MPFNLTTHLHILPHCQLSKQHTITTTHTKIMPRHLNGSHENYEYAIIFCTLAVIKNDYDSTNRLQATKIILPDGSGKIPFLFL